MSLEHFSALAVPCPVNGNPLSQPTLSRARREQPERFCLFLPESQGQNLAVTVLYVPGGELRLESYLTESVCKVVLQKSIAAQIHQLVLHVSNNKG